MKQLLKKTVLLSVLLLCGCFAVETQEEEISFLARWQNEAVARHSDGETIQSLRELASRTAKSDELHKLPDSARFAREADPEKAAALSREILWQSAEFAMVQFVPDPMALVREFRNGELRCQTAVLIAEKLFLDRISWKTPAQEQRYSELESELSALCGGIPFGGIDSGELVTVQDTSNLTAMAAEALSMDPAEAIQIAGVIYLIPDEIRRQKLVDPAFDTGGIINEIRFLAGSYALMLDKEELLKAEQRYLKNPDSENLWHYRRWYYRTLLDHSRMPSVRGSERDRQFIDSMLLLQEGF